MPNITSSTFRRARVSYSMLRGDWSWLNSDQHLFLKIADGSTQIPDERKRHTCWQIYVPPLKILHDLQELVNMQSSCFRTCAAALASHVICMYAHMRYMRVRAHYMYGPARYAVGEVPPNLNPPILLFGPLRTKLPNLKTANISGYTVYTPV